MNNINAEELILHGLINDESFTRRAIPFIKSDYFLNAPDKIIFGIIEEFFYQYNKLPSVQIVKVGLQEKVGIPEAIYDQANKVLASIAGTSEKQDSDWLTNTSEKWCRDKAVYNAIMKSINIIDGKDKVLGEAAIPTLLSEALAVTFDTAIGHDFWADADERYQLYHTKTDKIKFGLDAFDVATRGGFERKTVNVVVSPSGKGKSLFMCDSASKMIRAGYNCLYITMEMAEHKIAERIDSNLMGVSIYDLKKFTAGEFKTRLNKVQEKTQGKLVIKQYPTGAAHAGHFKALLEDLKAKKNFVPDIIYIDYLNICTSLKHKSKEQNSYNLYKNVIEEFRALATEYNAAIWTATQGNRSAIGNTDFDESSISDSAAIQFTADMVFAFIRSPELDKMGQIMIKQLKSRYDDINNMLKFIIGIDMKAFTLHDVEGGVSGMVDTAPDIPINSFGKNEKSNNESKFEGFTF